MTDLKEIERRVGASTDELNRRLGIGHEVRPQTAEPVRTVSGRVVPARAPAESRTVALARPSPLAGMDPAMRIALGVVAAFVLYNFFPFQFQFALVGIAIWIFQSVLCEVLFSRVGKKRLDAMPEGERCIYCQRYRWRNWFLRLTVCEVLSLGIFYFVIYRFFA